MSKLRKIDKIKWGGPNGLTGWARCQKNARTSGRRPYDQPKQTKSHPFASAGWSWPKLFFVTRTHARATKLAGTRAHPTGTHAWALRLFPPSAAAFRGWMD